MLQLPTKPPNLRKASSRNYRNLFITQPNLARRDPLQDAIAQLRARRPEEDKRDSEKERESMVRFLAYLKPSIPYFVVASVCGITVYLVPQLTPICTGYIIDRIIGVGAHGATGKPNFLYAPIDSLLLHTVGVHASKTHRIQVLMGSVLYAHLPARLYGGRGWPACHLQAAQRPLQPHTDAVFVVLLILSVGKHCLPSDQ
jgi:hypothetical protein